MEIRRSVMGRPNLSVRGKVVGRRWPVCSGKETQAGTSRQALPFQCTPQGAREALAFPPAPSGKCGAGALARVLSLAAVAWVCPKAERSETHSHYRLPEGFRGYIDSM